MGRGRAAGGSGCGWLRGRRSSGTPGDLGPHSPPGPAPSGGSMRPAGSGRGAGGGGVTQPGRPCSCGGDSAPAPGAAHRGSSRGAAAAGRSPRGGARSCSGARVPPSILPPEPRSTGAAPPRAARALCRPRPRGPPLPPTSRAAHRTPPPRPPAYGGGLPTPARPWRSPRPQRVHSSRSRASFGPFVHPQISAGCQLRAGASWAGGEEGPRSSKGGAPHPCPLSKEWQIVMNTTTDTAGGAGRELHDEAGGGRRWKMGAGRESAPGRGGGEARVWAR